MTLSLTRDASQATQIEQARAVAEVAAAVRYAQDNPRDQDRALDEFEQSCKHLEFAQRAFFGYSRGGARVQGPTIDFAQEAARCWQNMQSGSSELVRRATESEMVAFAWDLQMNTQRRTTFVSPHTGYTDTPRDDKPARQLVAVRDIRENNQSAASRVEREMILAVLPAWYVAKGKAWCHATLKAEGGDKPIHERRRDLIKRFEEFGVRRDELVAKIGAPVDAWLEADLATLIVIGQALRQGETTVTAEFRVDDPPTPTITARDLAAAAQPAPPPTPAAAPAPPATAPPAAASDPAPEPAPEPGAAGAPLAAPGQIRTIGILATAAKLDRAGRLDVVEAVTGRRVTTTKDLTQREAAAVVAKLEQLQAQPSAGVDFPEAVQEFLRVDEQRRMEAELATGES